MKLYVVLICLLENPSHSHSLTVTAESEPFALLEFWREHQDKKHDQWQVFVHEVSMVDIKIFQAGL